MNSTMTKSTTIGQRSFEDFVPIWEWVRGEGSDTLVVELPGFKKEHLKVQLDNYGNLRASGERPLDGNRWSRFRKNFHLPDDCNASEIRAKLDRGVLTVTIPKLIAEPVPVAAVPPPPTQAPEFQAMPKPRDPEPDSAKTENGKGVTEKIENRRKVEEEILKEENGGVMVGMKMKRKQLLINFAIAAIIMIGVGFFVAYKFKNIVEKVNGEELLDFDEFY